VLRAAAERGAQEPARRVLITVPQPFCHAAQDGLENATRNRGRVLDLGRQIQQLREQQQSQQESGVRTHRMGAQFSIRAKETRERNVSRPQARQGPVYSAQGTWTTWTRGRAFQVNDLLSAARHHAMKT
jgi:hypothetical protein